MGEFEIDVPQDRESQFEPKVIKKRQKDISDIDFPSFFLFIRTFLYLEILLSF